MSDIPEIVYQGSGRKRRIAVTADLQQWLREHTRDSKVSLSRALGISRPTLDRLLAACDISKKEAPKQKAIRKTAEKLTKEIAKEEKKVQKRAIRKKAKEIVKQRNLLTAMGDMTTTLDGTTVSMATALDDSLVAMGRLNVQANISLRAQVLAMQIEEQRLRDLPIQRAAITRLTKEAEKKKKEMQRFIEEKGLWTDIVSLTLDAWADAWLNYKIADWKWKRAGAPTEEVQVTAQAQLGSRPSMLHEAVIKAHKSFNDSTQKLRSDISTYYKMVSGDTDESTPLDDYIRKMREI